MVFDKKEYDKKHKQQKRDYMKKYREKNKECIKQRDKIYREKNREHIRQRDKQYQQTPQGKKSKTITCWKSLGLKLYGYTYDEVYEYYMDTTHCEVCKVELNTNTKTRKCMDHCHDTGCFRWILCNRCNVQDYWMKFYLGM